MPGTGKLKEETYPVLTTSDGPVHQDSGAWQKRAHPTPGHWEAKGVGALDYFSSSPLFLLLRP